MNQRLYLDLNIVQTVPPSNLNRDDAGTPKHATYGGVRRARVSSQAWKRAARMEFARSVPEADRATRTKKILELLTARIEARTGLATEASQRLAAALLEPLGIKKSAKKEEQSAYLLFFGRPQLDSIVDLIDDRATELAELGDKALQEALKDLDVREVLRTRHPAEVALFGRMVADLPRLNVDAAVQVAHALSTHPVTTEFDYYTAVDDENPDEETGAGMIGRVEFNAATLYRYATVGVHQLRDNLSDDAETARTVRRFVESFALSMPTGHQNSFAHRTVPHMLVACLRTDQPVNLVSAFEKPVLGQVSGIAEQSMVKLAEEATQMSGTWGMAPQLTLATYAPLSEGADKVREAFNASLAFPDLLDRVHGLVENWLRNGSLQ
ncbi:type I-E CRISPR-associated protein Cas7/Cse4/CasC [Nocardiopsis sp. FR6]|uniref:type I-E CRISPR-associated protein Cas7/Cse4/CasC n=1 Tax=Nocardiopsis sp. FR6 TaxID=2605986 RepID=UPI0013593660|nr:type I-E CRISPR-associated protein Cas7/Cse4/CasC [Nocardiopsis sp. FR6]